MKVVHVNAGCGGGAAEAALRLHRGLLRQGVDSTFLNLETERPDERVRLYRPSSGPIHRMERKWRWRRNAVSMRGVLAERHGFDCFSLDRTDLVPDVSAVLGEYDIVHLHAATDIVDLGRTLGAVVRRGQGLAWTLHDMNSFTGGCHYDRDCGRYRIGCGECPALGSRRADDLSARIWLRKRAAFSRLDPRRVRLVSPSRWLGEVARRSPLLERFAVTVIPYGLETDRFCPLDRQTARAALGLSAEARIVLLVASNLGTQRKGFDALRQALEKLNSEMPDLLFVCVGAASRPLTGQNVFLGPLNHPLLLRLAYAAADLMALPSLQDNFPNTVLESMACGTPVVGFASGGIPEMVRAGESGLVVPTGDIPALTAALRSLLSDAPERHRLGRRARQIAEEEYDVKIQAAAYHDLYQTLLP